MSSTAPVDANGLNHGDTAWMITATALVFMMTPALGFFYGGLVDGKNVINTVFLSFITMGLVTVQWILFGYSLAFQPRAIGIGGGNWATLGTGLEINSGEGISVYSVTYPQLVHAMYQCAFAVITAALISGAIIGRMKLPAYVIFILIWTTICYDVIVHWIWSTDGWMAAYGMIDFAGGYAVEINSGVSAITASYVLGKRLDYDPNVPLRPAHIPLTVMGAGLLWIGWIGFNGGSGNAADGIAGLAITNTNGAAASALLAWAFMDAVLGHPSLVGACLGSIVGLVAITPCAGFVQPGWAVFIGFVASLVSYGLMTVKHWFQADDTLDVFIAHGMGGITGHFMLGLFCEQRLNPLGKNGAFYGNPFQLWAQIAGILTTIAYSAACTAGILLVLKYTIGIRLDATIEQLGLDEALHNETWMIQVNATDAEGNVKTQEMEVYSDEHGGPKIGLPDRRAGKESMLKFSSKEAAMAALQHGQNPEGMADSTHGRSRDDSRGMMNGKTVSPYDEDRDHTQRTHDAHELDNAIDTDQVPRLNERQATADSYDGNQYSWHQNNHADYPPESVLNSRGGVGGPSLSLPATGAQPTSIRSPSIGRSPQPSDRRGRQTEQKENGTNRSGSRSNSHSREHSRTRYGNPIRSGPRGQQQPTSQMNLSQAVAQLVASMALPGHHYDIGISRSC